MVLHQDRGPDVAAAVITMVRLVHDSGAAILHGIGATNATLALPGNEGYTETGLFWFFLFEVFYCVNIIPVKLSIGLTLIRIAENRKGYIHAQYAVMAMFTVMNLIAGFYIIFHCNPPAAAWDTSLLEKGGSCNPAYVLADIYYATTAVNIFTDWVTAFMPIPLLWNLKVNRNTKISVVVILGLGFFASVSACVRLKYTVNLTAQEDYLYALADIVIWGYAENGLGLIVGCVMTLRPMFRRVFRLGGDSSNKASNGMTPSSRYAFGTANGRRTYQEFDPEYELRTGRNGSPDGASPTGGGNHMTTTVVSGHGKLEDDHSSFETESQKKMLQGDEPVANLQFQPYGITVTKQVKLSHD
ncbi:uncharacterized protein B0T15DRAFT_430740 [Chaetomium strumarium]|uniref:Rhodopsin domain-containing protein n=1 Tax=Chaetomium strumarium TaxID=1170767 RepID=A0AAJ0GZY6_9PEZI|nr:hypothetical protein B0T15DRAFT_430740 [Chaetomium strumarium]